MYVTIRDWKISRFAKLSRYFCHDSWHLFCLLRTTLLADARHRCENAAPFLASAKRDSPAKRETVALWQVGVEDVR